MTALILLAGLFSHAPKPIVPAPLVHTHGKYRSSQLALWRNYIKAVTKQMPKWDADSPARFERDQIATVKADLVRCDADAKYDTFVKDANTLRNDFNALIALDEQLEKETLL